MDTTAVAEKTKAEMFETLMAEYGSIDDAVVVARDDGDKTELSVRSKNDTKKLIPFSSCAMRVAFADDSGEGNFLSNGKVVATERPKANFVVALTSGVIRDETLTEDPLIVQRQRAFNQHSLNHCKHLMGLAFDYEGASNFSERKAQSIKASTETEEAVFAGRLEMETGKSFANKKSEEYVRLVKNAVAQDAKCQENIKIRARENFIENAKYPFSPLPENEKEDLKPIYFKRGVWKVRKDRLASWARGKRPKGPGSELPFSEQQWKVILEKMGEEYEYNPFKYFEAASGSELKRPDLKVNGKRVMIYDKDADGEDNMRALPNPAWSPINGKRYNSMVSMGGFLDVYCLAGAGYGVSIKTFGNINVFDRVVRPENAAGSAGGDGIAAKAISRKIIDIEQDDQDSNDGAATAEQQQQQQPQKKQKTEESFTVCGATNSLGNTVIAVPGDDE